METIDQAFVSLKHWFVALFPPGIQPSLSAVVTVASLIAVFGSLFAITTLVERKALGRMQNRLGPNRVGPFGLLQPLADAVKMLTKEDIVPHTADRVVHFLAPVALLVPVSLALAVLPYGRNMAPMDLDGGILFFFAVGAAAEDLEAHVRHPSLLASVSTASMVALRQAGTIYPSWARAYEQLLFYVKPNPYF
jgi:NADH-quinone oxidoreductase subunit H